jgi:outer membrane protein assembly factor BamB
MYHNDQQRSGSVAEIPDPQHFARLWQAHLDGAVYAEPLIVGGRVLVATEHDSLYALDPQSGQVEWRTSLGSPVPLGSLPCGNIDPLGITGTPVYDPQTGLVFAVAEITGPAHVLFGVDITTGQIKVRRSVDVPGMDPKTHQQRAALALSGGRVYVPYGGLLGDCGDYHGRIVAVRSDGSGPLLSFQVPTSREGGIWATPGPAVDAQGNLYVAVGNGAATGGQWDHTDSVLRLSPALQLEDGFAPQSWASDNASDADLGSMGPVLIPGGFVYADGKSGQGYLLRADHLGGIGGQIQTLALCHAYGGAAVSGTSLVIPCTDGLRQVTLDVTGSAPRLVPGWHAHTQVTGSPVIGGQTVYSLDPSGGTLYALDAATGAIRATLAVGEVSRFATPTLSGGRIFVGTLTGVTAVT